MSEYYEQLCTDKFENQQNDIFWKNINVWNEFEKKQKAVREQPLKRKINHQNISIKTLGPESFYSLSNLQEERTSKLDKF